MKSVFPIDCQLGASVEITLDGTELGDGSTLHFSQPGLSAEHLEKNRFRVTASADAAVGDCELWVATPAGLVGPRRFSITPHVVVIEQEGNDTLEEAQEVALPVIIDGRLDKSADLDWFAFAGQPDQLITITCRSPSVDGSVLPTLTLCGPDGCELAHSSAHQNEPRVTYRLPTAGAYRVLVHDRAYRKDAFSIYRLELELGSQGGTTAERNRSLLQPDDLFGAISVATEQESSRLAPQLIEIPCRLSGRFDENNDVDWFRVQAKKDQRIHIEAFGERLGQLMDLEVVIYNAKDQQVTMVSDITTPKGIPATLPLASLDPASTWKVPDDGAYSIAIRDLYGGSVFGPKRSYELIVADQQPGFFAVALSGGGKPSRGVFVKQGGSTELSLIVVRTGGFSGPVTIREVDAGPELTIGPHVVDGKENTKAISLSASKIAPTGFRSLRLVAEAKIDSDMHSIPVLNAVQVRSGITRRVDEMIIYVSE